MSITSIADDVALVDCDIILNALLLSTAAPDIPRLPAKVALPEPSISVRLEPSFPVSMLKTLFESVKNLTTPKLPEASFPLILKSFCKSVLPVKVAVVVLIVNKSLPANLILKLSLLGKPNLLSSPA